MDDATTAARSAAERRAEAVAPARQGRLAEAERALDALLRDAPDDVEALK